MFPLAARCHARVPAAAAIRAWAATPPMPPPHIASFVPLRSTQPPRRHGSTQMKAAMLAATTEVAQRLHATNLWLPRRTSAEVEGRKIKADKTRVNIVSVDMCNDILKYIGPSLDRHRGCDLIDMYPGAGLWSTALHDYLQPRSHILMEPDIELYQSFLDPLLQRPGVRVIPQSGILWNELTHLFRNLEHQTVPASSTDRLKPTGPRPERNDTLLLTANLRFFPLKRYSSFRSASTLIMYQLLSAIRQSSLVQRYGLVRMLLWVGEEDKRPCVPKSVKHRRRFAVDAELSCEWIHIVAENDHAGDEKRFSSRRSDHMDRYSAACTWQRMQEAKIDPFPGRETAQLQDVRRNKVTAAILEEPLLVKRKQMHDLDLAETQHAARSDKEASKRLSFLRRQHRAFTKNDQLHASLLAEQMEINALAATDREEALRRDEAWGARARSFLTMDRLVFPNLVQNHHLFRQQPGPVLLWDRRAYEPLRITPTDFFPTVDCCLLDIQPKPMHPLLRDMGKGSSHAGDCFEFILRTTMGSGHLPISKAMEIVWNGGSNVVGRCGSFTDPVRGGMIGRDLNELSARIMNQEQWIELLERWMEWPFRPTYLELIGRLAEGGDLWLPLASQEDDWGAG